MGFPSLSFYLICSKQQRKQEEAKKYRRNSVYIKAYTQHWPGFSIFICFQYKSVFIAIVCVYIFFVLHWNCLFGAVWSVNNTCFTCYLLFYHRPHSCCGIREALCAPVCVYVCVFTFVIRRMVSGESLGANLHPLTGSGYLSVLHCPLSPMCVCVCVCWVFLGRLCSSFAKTLSLGFGKKCSLSSLQLFLLSVQLPKGTDKISCLSPRCAARVFLS